MTELLATRPDRRLIVWGVVRALVSAAVLGALYFLVPLDRIQGAEVPLSLFAGLAVLLAVVAWQVRTILRADYPGIRAAEALGISAPAFLLLFAAAYFLMARANPSNFNLHPLTRVDTLYFTVSTFATVGFGDITATSQPARLLITAQMLLDLIVLGFGVRLFIGAVQMGRKRKGQASGSAGGPV